MEALKQGLEGPEITFIRGWPTATSWLGRTASSTRTLPAVVTWTKTWPATLTMRPQMLSLT